MLRMEARLKSTFPDMPSAVKRQFTARLNEGGYTEDAWSEALVWLESTEWFRLRGRHLGRP